MLGTVFSNQKNDASFNDQAEIEEDSNIVLEHEGEYKVVVIKEEVEDGVIDKEYHDSVLVDSVFISEKKKVIHHKLLITA